MIKHVSQLPSHLLATAIATGSQQGGLCEGACPAVSSQSPCCFLASSRDIMFVIKGLQAGKLELIREVELRVWITSAVDNLTSPDSTQNKSAIHRQKHQNTIKSANHREVIRVTSMSQRPTNRPPASLVSFCAG